MINQVFKGIQTINSLLDADIMEVSVKASQVVLTFYNEIIISMNDLRILDMIGENLKITDVTCFQNRLYVSFRDMDDLDTLGENSEFVCFKDLIVKLRDLLCTCPALEYVASAEYLKIFLDLPNVRVSDLCKLSDTFDQDPFIEFSGDRPYLLFINEDYMIQEEVK